MARVNKTYVVENHSDDELDDGETVESTDEGVVAGGSMPPPSYTELLSFFGLLWSISPSHGAIKAGNLLRRARMSFIRDFASKPRQYGSTGGFAVLWALQFLHGWCENEEGTTTSISNYTTTALLLWCLTF